MTNRIYTTQFTVPASTAIAAPLVQAVRLDDEQLDLVEIVIPDGHVGLTGLAILWSGVQIAPYIAGTWITGDHDKVKFAYSGEVTAGGLSLAGYNIDTINPHSFYLRWHISLLGQPPSTVIVSPQASAPAPADVASILALTG